ncbi:hypothetical protein CRI85_08085 [Leuconostoc pseudomesenteroides]|nr:hypothetical protein [Leuconostoc pseudomesenteroides]
MQKKINITIRPLNKYNLILSIMIIGISYHEKIYNFIFLYFLFMLPEIIKSMEKTINYFKK